MSQQSPTPVAPAGWYPDPAGSGGLRWWDGWTWTDDERPPPGSAHPRWRRVVALVLVVALVVATTAAAIAVWRGADAAVRLDTAAIEREVARVLSQQRGTEVRVECPDDVRLEAGAVITCTTRSADGAIGTVQVRQDNADGDVTWRVTD